MTETYVFDRYASPNKEHWLGTDTNGMDMLTRLMYGGRVSLIIGFIVVAIEAPSVLSWAVSPATSAAGWITSSCVSWTCSTACLHAHHHHSGRCHGRHAH